MKEVGKLKQIRSVREEVESIGRTWNKVIAANHGRWRSLIESYVSPGNEDCHRSLCHCHLLLLTAYKTGTNEEDICKWLDREE